MSENNVAPMQPPKNKKRILLLISFVLLLAVLYGVGFVLVPASIQRNLQNRNCESVLSWNKFHTRLYPAFMRDASLAPRIQECEIYVQAVSSEEKENWRESHDAYQVYRSSYPQGMFQKEAYEHSAMTLLNVVQDQVEQKQYEQAVPNLTQILLQYTDTSASADAKKLLPQVYADWAVALREAGNFEVAEQKLLEFQSWSQNEGQAELAVEARRHLARTYIDWSLALLAHEQYETALDKLDLAVKSDPHSDFESAPEERSTRRKVYVGWGNDFLKRDDIATAINKFKQAVSLADGDEDDGARDALTGALVRSAAGLSEKEDFQAAIEQLELAEASARSDETKQSVATALSDTYLAFSKSSGPQARIALREAMDTICKKHKKPELPIFGINPDLIRMSSNTADVKLPDDMIARTPGEMHYVVCTEIDNKIVDSRKHMQIVQKTSRGYYYRFVAQYRAQMIWNVTLYDVSTGESVATTVLTGGTPPPFPDGPYDGGGYTYGTPPPMEELLKWLKAATAD